MNQMCIEDTYTALLYELAFTAMHSVSGFVAKAMFSSVAAWPVGLPKVEQGRLCSYIITVIIACSEYEIDQFFF